jgi:hypothetical protein
MALDQAEDICVRAALGTVADLRAAMQATG